MVSSDENPEVEVVAGGSNAWNPGDYIHYLYRTEPLSGDFDVTIAVSRYDRSANQGGYSNSGLMLRVSPYLSGEEYTAVGTQVPMVANTTYLENSSPGRGAIPLWRTADHAGYGNGKADFSWQTLIGGKKGYYAGLRAMDASGAVDPKSSADSARYLRIKRTGKTYFFYASWDGVDWAQVDRKDLPELPDQLLLGFSTMTDSGSTEPPFSAYANNGHQIDPNDPLNPETDPSWPGGRSYMNESNYAAQRIKVFPKGVTTPLPVALTLADIKPQDSTALAGSWTSTGTYAFDMTGGGTGAFRNLATDGTGGDEVSFAYEEITGDFDKQVRITSLTSAFFNADGTAYVPAEGETLPVDAWARGGLMARSSTAVSSASLKLVAGNPAGANEVRVIGRGIDAQNYTMFSRSYPGVTNALPNQWLRLQRVGNAFSFYVSKEGIDWVLVGQRYQEMPANLLVGAYAAASLNPTDATANPAGLLATAAVKFADYKTVNLGDLVPPTLVSVGSLDKKTIGVKFSEAVGSATATIPANYTLSQGTVTAAKLGIGGDAVYLTVTGLTADTFTVTVNGVKDTAGNAITASTAQGKVSAWISQDVGSIQKPNQRPTPGDDPYRVGQAVALSSDENTEVEIIGGGSNAWNSGDFLHYLYQAAPLVGDFDVAVAVSRYDRSANQGGYSNAGLMLRASPYLAGSEYTSDGTKVPMVANVTYLENSGPGRGAIPLWRTEAGGGYGNGAAGYAWTTLIGGIKGYYSGLRATDASGTRDPESSPTSARWLRIKREGSTFHFYASWDGQTWDNYDNAELAALPNSLLLGISTMTDSGSSTPPYSAYGGNGHTLDAADPLNPAVAGGNVMNESNYAAQRIRIYPKGPVSAPPGPIAITSASGQVTVSWPGTATLQSATSVNGPWTAAANQANPQVVTPAAAQTFYRLAR
jgi:regulation of enolase protein 1 (concanavalin A-like superfamily)